MITTEKIAELRALIESGSYENAMRAVGVGHDDECGDTVNTRQLAALLNEIESLRANNAQAWAECERQRFLAGDADIYRAQNTELCQACRLALEMIDIDTDRAAEKLSAALGE
jgi:hypothetical protein